MNPGDIIGHRYRIIRSLGEGGMANVYLAHDLVLDRDVSVKLLRLDLRDDPDTKRRFHREALAATQLNDPHARDGSEGFYQAALPDSAAPSS